MDQSWVALVSARQLAKHAAQAIASRVAPVGWSLRRSPRLLVLMYHRVLPHEHPDRAHEEPGMYVSPETFAMQLDQLSRHFEMVHLEDWLERTGAGQSVPPRACAITFDDGWRDNFQYAYPALSQRGLPATIYLVSDMVGSSYSFWPNRLTRVLLGPRANDAAVVLAERLLPIEAGQGAEWIARIIHACKAAQTDEQMNGLLDDIESRLPAAARERDLLSWDEIETMASGGLVRFGSHTRRHTRLLHTIPQAQLDDEINGSQRVLQERLGRAPKTFCYPNGDHSSEAVARVRASYLGAVTTRRGWNSPGSDRFLLARVGVHEDVSNTPASFLARLAGVG